MKAQMSDESVWEVPRDVPVRTLLRTLSPEAPWVVFGKESVPTTEDEYYFQIYANPDGSYQMEFREGGADRHYALVVPSGDEEGLTRMAEAVTGWAADETAWRELPWQKLAF